MKRYFALVLIPIVVAGCDCGGKPGKKSVEQSVTPADNSPAVAWTVDKTITLNDFESELSKLPPQQKDWGNSSQGRRYILDTYIDAMLIDGESEKRALSKRADIVAKLQAYRRQVIKDALMEDILKTAPVTDDEALKYYNEHPSEFRQPERVKIYDMVVKDEGTARQVMAGLLKGGSFEKAARDLSIDNFTKNRGGDIPEFSREMRPDLFDAVRNARKSGQIFGPQNAQDGIHVIQFIKRIPADEKKFEDIKDSLKGRIVAQKRQAAYSQFLHDLRETAGVRLDNSFIEDGAVPAGKGSAEKNSGAGSQPVPPKGK